MEKKENCDKVVVFAQNTTKSKSFRQDYPISSELRQIIVGEVFSDFKKYVMDHYHQLYLPISEGFITDHDILPEKRPSLELNLFWWRLLYDLNLNVTNSVEDYIIHTNNRLSKKPFFISWLKEIRTAAPKFYQVEEIRNDYFFVIREILTNQTFDVTVYESNTSSPKKGEIIMGTILQIGGRVYFPITDFYHFDYDARTVFAKNITYYYNKHLKTSNKGEAFIHVLSSLLQIERLIELI